MSIIYFIRKNKNLDKDILIEKIKAYFPTIKTNSDTKVLVDLFKNNYANINRRRLSELLKWINDVFKMYEPNSSVEGSMCKIRGLVKVKFGYDSPEYKASLKYLVFDKIQKEKNIEKYNKQVNYNLKHSEDIPISLINKIFSDNAEGDTIEQILSYLLMNCGCRYAELYDSIFTLMEDGQITQSHIAKTKNKERSITKKLLDLNSEKWIEKLANYRSLNIDRIYGLAQLNKYLHEKYKFSSYHCRKYFANVSYNLDADKKEQKQSYLSEILGHDSVDIAKIYSAFNVVFDEDITFRFT